MVFRFDFWQQRPSRLLGKRPAVPGAVSWRYKDIFNRDQLMRPPLVFGHILETSKIPMLGNQKVGNCVWCTQAHLLQSMQRGLGKPETVFSDDSVISDYAAATGYMPGRPATDQGTLMGDGAKYWRKTGIIDAAGKRHQITAYVEIRLRDLDEIWQATHDFGGISLGVTLPQSAMDDFDAGRPWHNVKPNQKILGGHAVALVGRNSRGDGVLATWDNTVGVSPEWITRFMDEAVAFVSLEYLDEKGVNPRGYDRVELEKRLTALA